MYMNTLLRSLFEEEKDCIELIKIKEIMHELAKNDRCGRAGRQDTKEFDYKIRIEEVENMELLVIIIVLALIFDYINGFHDAANSIATIVSTKVLTPFQAVIWAAFFNFVAIFYCQIFNRWFRYSQYCVQDCDGTVYYTADYIIRSDCCHSMESVYLVEGYSLIFFPYPYWRICRSRHYGSWFRCYSTQYHSEDCGFHISCSFDRNDCCLRIHIVGSLCLPACTSPYS